jgi:hypothetical protein
MYAMCALHILSFLLHFHSLTNPQTRKTCPIIQSEQIIKVYQIHLRLLSIVFLLFSSQSPNHPIIPTFLNLTLFKSSVVNQFHPHKHPRGRS